MKYDQLKPAKEKFFDPISIACKGSKVHTKVGYIPDSWNETVDEDEYAYACVVIDEN